MLTFGADQLGYEGPRHWQKARKYEKAAVVHENDETFEGRALSLSETQRLITALDDDKIAEFVAVMFMSLQRPQALRMTDVRDFDPAGRRLKLRFGKNRSKRAKAINIPLFQSTVDMLLAASAGRGPKEPLLLNGRGERFPEDFQRYPIPAAARSAKLGDDATLYAVRRGAITHAITIEKIDVLTVSEMADVDPKLILEHYFKREAELPGGPQFNVEKVVPFGVVRGGRE